MVCFLSSFLGQIFGLGGGTGTSQREFQVKEAVFPGKLFHHQVQKLGKTFIFLQLSDFN